MQSSEYIYAAALCHDDVTPACMHRSMALWPSQSSARNSPKLEDRRKMEVPVTSGSADSTGWDGTVTGKSAILCQYVVHTSTLWGGGNAEFNAALGNCSGVSDTWSAQINLKQSQYFAVNSQITKKGSVSTDSFIWA